MVLHRPKRVKLSTGESLSGMSNRFELKLNTISFYLFMTQVCLPMVRRCPTEVSRALYLSTTAAGSAFDPGAKGENTGMPVLRRLSAVFERRIKQTGKFLAGPLIASCCFALVEVRRLRFFFPRRILCRSITCGQSKRCFAFRKTVFH